MRIKRNRWGHRLIIKRCKFCHRKKWMRQQSISCSRSCNGKGGAKIAHESGAIQYALKTEKYKKEQSERMREFYKIHPEKVTRLIGHNNPAWKHGQARRGYTNFTEALKDKIRRRDKYQCQSCGEKWNYKGPKFDVHHINGNKDNFNESNLTTLCKRCHTTLHRKNQ